MILRQQIEAKELAGLAPYASASGNSLGRRHPEKKAKYRTEFQRDRDRVIHSTAFRRLEYKTQVFFNHEGDHYRTRLTHSLEVAQIGRSVARSLSLNEDLVEALVLSHDLGHTPFGHSGERAMAELMAEHGGFEHNRQSLRVVDHLERCYPGFPGLNLTFEVREGIAKHAAGWDPKFVSQDLCPAEQPSLEAQLIDHVDEIAYNNHDVDDGLYSQLIDHEALEAVDLWKDAFFQIEKEFPGRSFLELKRPTISRMIALLVNDLIEQTWQNLSDAKVKTVSDVRSAKVSWVGFSKEMAEKKDKLKRFLWEHLYTHDRVVCMEKKARRVIQDLFQTYTERPEQLSQEWRDHAEKEGKPRVVCDYIAGMTDRFALEEHRKLFDPHSRV